MMLDLYFAYFYNPRSTPVDGWYDRFCCVCDERGCIERKEDYDFLCENHYICLGHYKQGSESLDVWREARVK
jgi:hypothetical protein